MSQKEYANQNHNEIWFPPTRMANIKTDRQGTSLVVQGLRLPAPNAGGQGSNPCQVTRSHMLQLRVRMPQLKILHATNKTWRNQINK